MTDEHSLVNKKEKKKKSEKFKSIIEGNNVERQPSNKISSNKIPADNAWIFSNSMHKTSINLNDFPELIPNTVLKKFTKFDNHRTSKNGAADGSSCSQYDQTINKYTQGKTAETLNSYEKKDLEQTFIKTNLLGKQRTPATMIENSTSATLDSNTKTKVRNKAAFDETVHKKQTFKPKSQVEPSRNPYKKKRADPTFFNLEDALDANKKREQKMRIRNVKKKFQRNISREKLSGNILDASNPIRKKGKHREIKRKRVSNLKSLIIKERIIKRIYRENKELFISNDVSSVLEKVDFKMEVEKYLRERNLVKKMVGLSLKDTKPKDNPEFLCNDFARPEIKKEAQKVSVKTELYVSSMLNSRKFEVVDDIENLPRNKSMFSSKMREYCENMVTPELNAAVRDLVNGLANFQDRAYSRDPIKARSKKRHIEGIKEVRKYLILKKVKLVVIPPNLEKSFMKGSVGDLINELKTLAKSQEVPCVYAMDRYTLGRCAKKSVPVSALAVLIYDGLEDRYEEVLKYWQEAKKAFDEKVAKLKEAETEADDINSKVTSTLLSSLRESLVVCKSETNQQKRNVKGESFKADIKAEAS